MFKTQIDADEKSSILRLCRNIEEISHKSISERGEFNIAISGGETAKKMYAELVNFDVDWKLTKIFWVDERCVGANSPDSNYGCALKLFIDPLKIPQGNVFRLRGEECPVTECERYSLLLQRLVSNADKDGTPSLDCVILGMGADSHTASIFPCNMNLLSDPKLYAVSHNPKAKFWRMTMTGRTILAAKKILLPVYGGDKKTPLKKMLSDISNAPDSTPISTVISRAKDAEILTDIDLS